MKTWFSMSDKHAQITIEIWEPERKGWNVLCHVKAEPALAKAAATLTDILMNGPPAAREFLIGFTQGATQAQQGLGLQVSRERLETALTVLEAIRFDLGVQEHDTQ